jgi:D-aminopeptidase
MSMARVVGSMMASLPAEIEFVHIKRHSRNPASMTPFARNALDMLNAQAAKAIATVRRVAPDAPCE